MSLLSVQLTNIHITQFKNNVKTYTPKLLVIAAKRYQAQHNSINRTIKPHTPLW